MQNFKIFEESSEGASGDLIFVHKVYGIFLSFLTRHKTELIFNMKAGKNSPINLFEISENYNFVDFISIEANQHTWKQPKQSRPLFTARK